MTETLLPVRVAIFASGKGSNAAKIVEYFQNGDHPVLGRPVEIALIVSSRADAGVLEIARSARIPSIILEKEKFRQGSYYPDELKAWGIEFIVLAGFLWKVPTGLIAVYPDRILNIHPALLPAYGGKGMYGEAVHRAVVAANEKESGITIHAVDEIYDHGNIFFQARFPLTPNETPESLAEKIHALEHQYYPAQIRYWMECKLSLNP